MSLFCGHCTLASSPSFRGDIVKKVLACAALLAGFTGAAHAADSVKDAIPAIPDGPITWMGVTFYGTVDVGYTYIDNGAYPSGAHYYGASYSVYGSPYNHGAVSTLTNNALQLSNVGLKIEEQLGGGFLAVGKLETQFNPISGELGDACASMLRYSGKSLYNQDKNGDGSRCGQIFNNAAYGGVSNPIYGTLTVGRQGSLVNDGMGAYDPIAGSPAFSLLGYSATAGAGVGSSEPSTWDNSVKYIFTYGPAHAAGMYTNGGQDTPMVGDGYGANVGITYAGFSIDGFYTKENGAVNLRNVPLATNLISGSTALFPGSASSVQTSCNAALGNCPNYLLGTITDNEAWDVMAKYTFNVPSLFSAPEPVSTKDVSLKDAPVAPPSAKLTFYGGYQYVEQSNPENPQYTYSGNTTIGGYRYVSTGLLAFGSDRIRETIWAGASYVDGPWRLAAAWYRYSQDSYLNSSFQTCATTTANTSATARFRVGSNCAAEFNQGSLLVDYTVNRHFDIYAGVSFAEQSGGFNSGSLEDNSIAFASGVRIKW
jgi:predicted porin